MAKKRKVFYLHRNWGYSYKALLTFDGCGVGEFILHKGRWYWKSVQPVMDEFSSDWMARVPSAYGRLSHETLEAARKDLQSFLSPLLRKESQ